MYIHTQINTFLINDFIPNDCIMLKKIKKVDFYKYMNLLYSFQTKVLF